METVTKIVIKMRPLSTYGAILILVLRSFCGCCFSCLIGEHIQPYLIASIAHIHCKSLFYSPQFIYFLHAVHFQSKAITCRFTLRCPLAPYKVNFCMEAWNLMQSQKLFPLIPICHRQMFIKLHCTTRWEVALLNGRLVDWFLLFVSMIRDGQLICFSHYSLWLSEWFVWLPDWSVRVSTPGHGRKL